MVVARGEREAAAAAAPTSFGRQFLSPWCLARPSPSVSLIGDLKVAARLPADLLVAQLGGTAMNSNNRRRREGR